MSFVERKPPGYWTKEQCKKDASRFMTRTEWANKSASSYSKANARGWLDKCSKHMVQGRKPDNYWTRKRCKKDAKKYQVRYHWNRNSVGAAIAAQKHGWYEECTKHMVCTIKPANYWTKDRCLAEAKKYKTRTKWFKHSGGSVNAAQRNGWILECTMHMTVKKKPAGYWTKRLCLESAKKYKRIADWKNNEKGAINAALNNGWYTECTSHMEKFVQLIKRSKKEKPIAKKDYWTLERCKKDANQYHTTANWKSSGSTGFYYAKKNGWIDECIKGLKLVSNGQGYWNLERCKKNASTFVTRTQWMKSKLSGYQFARKNGWLEICCAHMKSRANFNSYED